MPRDTDYCEQPKMNATCRSFRQTNVLRWRCEVALGSLYDVAVPFGKCLDWLCGRMCFVVDMRLRLAVHLMWPFLSVSPRFLHVVVGLVRKNDI
jgi:hypothetical protein